MTAGTILVIEDNAIQRLALVTTLHRQGFRVLTATDGNDALNRLSNGSIPDLILLDMLIPTGHGDGWWFLEQRTGIPALASVPVIITTSLPSASAEQTSSLGADRFVRKPFEDESLLAEIRRCLADRDGQGL
jgi:two-component system phosphate regulon response regulator PhoB